MTFFKFCCVSQKCLCIKEAMRAFPVIAFSYYYIWLLWISSLIIDDLSRKMKIFPSLDCVIIYKYCPPNPNMHIVIESFVLFFLNKIKIILALIELYDISIMRGYEHTFLFYRWLKFDIPFHNKFVLALRNHYLFVSCLNCFSTTFKINNID